MRPVIHVVKGWQRSDNSITDWQDTAPLGSVSHSSYAAPYVTRFVEWTAPCL